MKKNKVFKHTLDLVLVLLFVTLLIFTAVVLYIFDQTGSEPTALVYSFFGAITGEAGFCSIIMRGKQKASGSADDSANKPPGNADGSDVKYTDTDLDKGGGT